MSIFINESVNVRSSLVANEDYQGEVGAYAILAENVQNDLAMFNGMIAGDFMETKAIHESASNDQLMVLVENAGVGLLDNIKVFLKKAHEKIKGLIKAFITNLQTVVTRDNAKLVDRHRKNVYTKDLSKLKFQWSTCKDDKDAVYPKPIKETGRLIDGLQSSANSSSGAVELSNTSFHNLVSFVDGANVDEMIKDINTPENKAETIASAMGISKSGKIEYSSLTSSAIENLFDEKEQIEGMSNRLRDNIMESLSTSKDVIKGLKDAEKKIDAQYNKEIKRIDKLRNEFVALVPSGGNIGDHKVTSEQASKAVKGVNYIYELLKVNQEVMTKSINTTMSIIKFKIKESRAAFARAAAYRAVGEEGTIEAGDEGDNTVEINIQINDQEEQEELLQAIDDDSDHVVEEQFGFMGY